MVVAHEWLFFDDYWKASCRDIETLETMEAWVVVDINQYMNIIDSTWDLILKRFPDGLIRKLKVFFCSRGY